jgi:hypothetical protein
VSPGEKMKKLAIIILICALFCSCEKAKSKNEILSEANMKLATFNEYILKDYIKQATAYITEHTMRDNDYILREMDYFKSKTIYNKKGLRYYPRISFVYSVYDDSKKCKKALDQMCLLREDPWDVKHLLKGKVLSASKTVPKVIIANEFDITVIEIECNYEPEFNWGKLLHDCMDIFMDKNDKASFYIEAGCGGPVKATFNR